MQNHDQMSFLQNQYIFKENIVNWKGQQTLITILITNFAIQASIFIYLKKIPCSQHTLYGIAFPATTLSPALNKPDQTWHG